MDQRPSKLSKGIIITWAASLAIVAMLAFVGFSFIDGIFYPRHSHEQALKQYEVISEIRTSLLTSLEKEKCAVMALSDEESQNYADQSREASNALERHRKRLDLLLNERASADEKAMLREFDASWKIVKETDALLLEYAVQHTNLKAYGLSNTMGAELQQKFEEHLVRLTAKVSPPARKSEMSRIAGQAISSALKITNLQNRHIGESDKEKKALLESEISTEAKKVQAALKTLDGMAVSKNRSFIRQASIGFSDIMNINEEVIRLSRLNTGRASVELSLGKKRIAAAECDRILKALLSKAKGITTSVAKQT